MKIIWDKMTFFMQYIPKSHILLSSGHISIYWKEGNIRKTGTKVRQRKLQAKSSSSEEKQNITLFCGVTKWG